MNRLRIFGLSFACLLAACTSGISEIPTPTTPDPLESIYGQYITPCLDLGGGGYNQLYASFSEDTGEVSLAILTWTNLNCQGTYKLTNFNGDTIYQAQREHAFSHVEVSDIPKNFYILKLDPVNSTDNVHYIVVRRSGQKLDVQSEYSTPHKTWAKWLEQAHVSEFVNNPGTYNATDPYVTFHFMETDGLPSKLAALYGNWLSDCVDFGGGLTTQVYAELSDEGIKSANLTWTNAGCAGTYTLTDTDGNPISAPTVSQKATAKYISGIPDNFFILKVTQLSNPAQVNFAVVALGNNEFYETVPYNASLGDTWADWLTDVDVADFATDPAAASPMMHAKLHFTIGELP